MNQNPKIPQQNPKLTNNESDRLTYSTKMMKRSIHLFIKPRYEFFFPQKKNILILFQQKKMGNFWRNVFLAYKFDYFF
jgi:hypothetical protein